MKLLKLFSGSLLLYFLFFSTGTQLVSCTPDPIFDTVYVKDTVTIRDTLTIRDTVDCNCYDLTQGLVAWYNFNGGNLNDSSGKGNHIIFNNATATSGRNGKPNSAFSFNGASSYMRVANSASLNPQSGITMSAVVKVNGFYSGFCKANQIFGKQYNGDYENGYYALRFADYIGDCYTPIDTAKIKFSGAYGDNYGSGGTSASTDNFFIKKSTWYHVVYTYGNGESRIYVNGNLIQNRADPAVFTPNSADVFIGKTINTQYPYFLNGVVDDIRIYDRALCSGEVKQLNRVTN